MQLACVCHIRLAYLCQIRLAYLFNIRLPYLCRIRLTYLFNTRLAYWAIFDWRICTMLDWLILGRARTRGGVSRRSGASAHIQLADLCHIRLAYFSISDWLICSIRAIFDWLICSPVEYGVYGFGRACTRGGVSRRSGASAPCRPSPSPVSFRKLSDFYLKGQARMWL